MKEAVKGYCFGGRQMRRHVARVQALYEMSAGQLADYSNERFLAVFRAAIRNSAFYRRLYGEAGIGEADIRSIDDLERLPVVTKEYVRQFSADILTVPRRKVLEYSTSGTTGTPLRLYMPLDLLRTERAHTEITRAAWGFRRGGRLLSLRGKLGKDSRYMYMPTANTLFLSAYNINDRCIDDYLQRIRRFAPEAVEAYPSSLYALACYVLEKGEELHIPVAFTSSETLLAHQRELIARALHTRVCDHYGLTERSIYLTQNPVDLTYSEAPGFSANEYREDCIITTSLVNEAFPLLRYRVDDVAAVAGGKVLGIEGRRDDYLLCRDGSRIMRLDFVFKGVDNVRESQLVQCADGRLLVNVVPDAAFAEADRQKIERNLIGRVGAGNVDYEIRMVDRADIERTASGKYKFLVRR